MLWLFDDEKECEAGQGIAVLRNRNWYSSRLAVDYWPRRDQSPAPAILLRVVTSRAPNAEELSALIFGWKVCKHVKSNAIVYALAGQSVSVGAGQMSRVDSVKVGAMKAVLPLTGTVLASDAFFPFPDGVEEAATWHYGRDPARWFCSR